MEVVLYSLRHWNLLPDALVLVSTVLLQVLWARRWMRTAPAQTGILRIGLGISLGLLFLGFSLLVMNTPGWVPLPVLSWTRAATLTFAALTVAFSMLAPLLGWIRVDPSHRPARRAFLRATQGVLFGSPVAALGYGVFIERREIRPREVNIAIPHLPQDLDGLKLMQLTDIHMGAFLDRRMLAGAVDLANEARADVALVTGDLISYKGDPLDQCLDELGRLRAGAGVLGCLGNHEGYAEAEDYVTAEGARRGIRFLRSESSPLKFGKACLNVAGVDYQQTQRPYLVGAEALLQPDAFNLLLSHNPDVFPVARAKGFPLTISGHTHGGQVRVEILRQDINVARFFTPYVDGVYQEDGSSIFVSRGIGTIGMPARLGAPPEVALIRLWRT